MMKNIIINFFLLQNKQKNLKNNVIITLQIVKKEDTSIIN
jgi:hypothetical protein